MTDSRPCPLCAATAATRLTAYAPADWDLGRCDTCGFVYLRNPPPYDALEEDLAWEVTSAAKKAKGGSTAASGLNRRLRGALGIKAGQSADDKFARWFGPQAHVLDIGCGDRVRTRPPIIPFGIELSRALHARADAQMRAMGGHCLQAPAADGVWQFDAASMDGAILHSSLEHEREPLRLLRGLARALKQGGKAFVRVPNFGSLNRRVIGRTWCGFRHPDHVNYFTLGTLRAMAAKAGFTTQTVNGHRLWVDDNIQALLVKT